MTTELMAPAQRVDVGARVHLATLLRRIVLYLLALSGVLLFATPFFFAISTSLKDPSEIYVFPPQWLPHQPLWQNYVQAWTMVPFMTYVLNTLSITVAAMLGQIVSASLVAYGFARFRFPGRDVLFIILILTMVVPVEVTIIPSFLLFKYLNWVDTWLPLIVPYYFGGGAFTIFLLRQFLLTLPRDLDEAAMLDGANSVRILGEILLPLSRPALATVGIFSFIYHWNDFFLPLIYINSTERFTLALGLRYFQNVPTVGGPVLAHYLMAAALSATLPMIIIFFALQRYFIQGIVMSGIKG
jgi:multiple sugar transport system permease protein